MMSWIDDMGGDPYDGEYDNDGDDEIPLRYFSLGRQTARAYFVCFEILPGLETIEHWMPKSCCSLGDDETIFVPKWLVDQAGLWDYAID